MNLVAAFADVHAAYQDQKYTSIVTGTPRLTGSIWATYALHGTPLEGFTVSFGVHGNSGSHTFAFPTGASNDGIQFPVPGYVVEDAMIAYARNDYSISLKVNNLTDRYFYYPTVTSNEIVAGEGRNFLVVCTKSF